MYRHEFDECRVQGHRASSSAEDHLLAFRVRLLREDADRRVCDDAAGRLAAPARTQGSGHRDIPKSRDGAGVQIDRPAPARGLRLVQQVRAIFDPAGHAWSFVREQPRVGQQGKAKGGRHGGGGSVPRPGVVVPHLVVRDTAEALSFYERAFGATVLYRSPSPSGDGEHLYLKLWSSLIQVSSEEPVQQQRRVEGALLAAPESLGGSTCVFQVSVPDVDAAYKRAVDEGGSPALPPTTMFWGDRYGWLRDPLDMYGHSTRCKTPQNATSADAFASLSFLEGTWDANVQNNAAIKLAGRYTFDRELNGHILARHATNDPGCKAPASFDCSHSDLLYIFQDPPGSALKADYFDSEGHVIHYEVTTPTPASAVFLSTPGPGPQFRLSYALTKQVMTGRFQVHVPGEADWRTYLEWSGSRKQ